jgi:ribosomal protein L29
VEKDIARLKTHAEKISLMTEKELRECTAKEMIGRQAYRLLEYFDSRAGGAKKTYCALIADILSGVYECNFDSQDIKWMTDDIFQRDRV